MNEEVKPDVASDGEPILDRAEAWENDTSHEHEEQGIPTVADVNRSEMTEASVTVEGTRTTHEQRNEAFAFGRQTLYKLLSDPRFQIRCNEAGVKPFDDSDPRYWRIFADFSRERIDAIRKQRGDKYKPEDDLRLRALGLVTTTPAYLYSQRAMYEGVEDDNQRREHLRQISSFHYGIVEYAELFLDIRASELTMAILSSVNTTIADPAMHEFANQEVRGRVRGIQHELAFADILYQTGLEFRRATASEDLSGFDYILTDGTQTEMKLDVKASLKKMDEYTSEALISPKGQGVFAVYSMIRDSELRNGFHIPEGLAREKAQVLIDHLGPGASTVVARLGA
ncbi:MAG TPA: hypothetical protein VMB52_05340 [Verrucomicrobiae bacterium]|nr:hypothetical protein [Verrucomicrobiae bacterium]